MNKIDNISDAIRQTIEQCGCNVLGNTSQFVNMLMDLYSFRERDIKLIKIACTLGYYKDLATTSADLVKATAKIMIKEMHDDYGIEESVSVEVINWLLVALGIAPIEVTAKIAPAQPVVEASQPVQPSQPVSAKPSQYVTDKGIEYKPVYENGNKHADYCYAVTKADDYYLKGKVVIPSHYLGKEVRIIKSNAFLYCQNMRELHIPDTVTMIEKDAFRDCYNLEKVFIPASVVSVGKNAFAGCNNSDLIIYLEKDHPTYGYYDNILGSWNPEKAKIYCGKSSYDANKR